MYNVFDKLKKAELFWGWLYGIAFNKIRSHYGRQWRQKTVPFGDQQFASKAGDALAEAVTAEWKQIVTRSMQECLNLRRRDQEGKHSNSIAPMRYGCS